MKGAKRRFRNEPALLQGLIAVLLAATLALGAIALTIAVLDIASARPAPKRPLAPAAHVQTPRPSEGSAAPGREKRP